MPMNDYFSELKNGEIFDVKMKYPLLGMKNAVTGCFVRRSVYELLKEVQASLPTGIRLRIWDAWRPLSLQKELYKVYRQSIISEFGLSSLSAKEQDDVISKYIAIPSENPDYPPAHTTGGAVDLTLIDAYGNELDMGTDFDDFSEKSATDYFERKEFDGFEIQKNRKILLTAMTAAGFTNLPSEWWHYDYGNSNWASIKGKNAFYKGVFNVHELNFE